MSVHSFAHKREALGSPGRLTQGHWPPATSSPGPSPVSPPLPTPSTDSRRTQERLHTCTHTHIQGLTAQPGAQSYM